MMNKMSYIPFNDNRPADSPTQQKTGHLPTGESIPLPHNTPQVLTHNNQIFSLYAGTSDGIAFYNEHKFFELTRFFPTSPDEMNGYYLSHLWCYNCGIHKDVHVNAGDSGNVNGECPK